MNQTKVIMNFLESVFNSGSFINESPVSPYGKRVSSTPLDKGIVSPFDTGPTASPPPLAPHGSASTPINNGPTVTPSYKRPTVTPSPVRPVDKDTIARHWGFWIPTQETTTYEPIYRLHWPTTRQRWDLKPPDIKVKPPIHVTTATGSKQSTNLEYFLWVVLGGIAVLVLMAIFMKIGKPIRRSRRQPSSARPSPIVTTRIEEPYYRNLDMGSHVRLMDADSNALAADPPPPYSACVRDARGVGDAGGVRDARGVGDADDPPPSFSSCCVTYTNTKDTEPKVHVQRPNGVCEHESIAMNDSEDVDGMRSELVFVNGRIVKRPKIDLRSSDTQIRITNSFNVKEQRSKSADLKSRIVDETDIVKVNIY